MVYIMNVTGGVYVKNSLLHITGKVVMILYLGELYVSFFVCNLADLQTKLERTYKRWEGKITGKKERDLRIMFKLLKHNIFRNGTIVGDNSMIINILRRMLASLRLSVALGC